jgi:uncharacterized protein YggE
MFQGKNGIIPMLVVAGFFCAAGVPARAQTELNLAATGQKLVEPDEMIASLQVQAASSRAATAQADVNSAMQKALALAKAVSGVTATTSSYSVFEDASDSAKPPKFRASQSLQLVMPAPGGVPPDRFTALVGQLQQNGLLLNSLDGDLSSSGQTNAEQGAIADAIGQIQAQAAMIADNLKKNVSEIKTLNVNVNMPQVIMRAPQAMMKAAEMPTPPQAAPDKVTIQANVSATIELTSSH